MMEPSSCAHPVHRHFNPAWCTPKIWLGKPQEQGFPEQHSMLMAVKLKACCLCGH